MLKEAYIPIIDGSPASYDGVERSFRCMPPPSPLVANEVWHLAPPFVPRQGVNIQGGGNGRMGMQRRVGESQQEHVFSGSGPPQTNFYHQDLSSAFSGMNISGEKRKMDEDKSETELDYDYLDNFVSSIVDVPSSSSGAPLNQRGFELINRDIVENHTTSDQQYLISGGNKEGVSNSNMLVHELIKAYYQKKRPVSNQCERSAYVPAILNYPGMPSVDSHVPDTPIRTVGLSSRPVMGSGNLKAFDNMDINHISSVLNELLKTKNTKSCRYCRQYCPVKDYNGSRFIQLKLQTASPEEKDMVFYEIMPQALTLMSHIFGNYVIQQFFDYGRKEQIMELINHMIGHVYQFILHVYSCRVIQKALEVIEVPYKIKLVAELEGHVLKCILDQNGNHVIQKCIHHVPEHAIQFILSVIFEQLTSLIIHPYGCRIIQRVVEHCHSEKAQWILSHEIIQNVTHLADDVYGNYVVQSALQYGSPHVRSIIIKKLTGQMIQMSTQKYSSNVVEKCVTYCSPEERKKIVNEMLDFFNGCYAFKIMMTDQYGNYVVQRVLETCNEQQLKQMNIRIKSHLNELRAYRYGKIILSRLEHLVITGEKRLRILDRSQAVFGQQWTPK